jgi:hypothetical protein
MNIKTIIRMAKPLRSVIGKHVPLIGTGCDHEVYQRAQADSDLAVQQAKYLIQYLYKRHDAVLFAKAVGMPGYINMR